MPSLKSPKIVPLPSMVGRFFLNFPIINVSPDSERLLKQIEDLQNYFNKLAEHKIANKNDTTPLRNKEGVGVLLSNLYRQWIAVIAHVSYSNIKTDTKDKREKCFNDFSNVLDSLSLEQISWISEKYLPLYVEVSKINLVRRHKYHLPYKMLEVDTEMFTVLCNLCSVSDKVVLNLGIEYDNSLKYYPEDYLADEEYKENNVFIFIPNTLERSLILKMFAIIVTTPQEEESSILPNVINEALLGKNRLSLHLKRRMKYPTH